MDVLCRVSNMDCDRMLIESYNAIETFFECRSACNYLTLRTYSNDSNSVTRFHCDVGDYQCQPSRIAIQLIFPK